MLHRNNHSVPPGSKIGLAASAKNWWFAEGEPTVQLAAPVMVARAGVICLIFVDSLMAGQASASELAFLGQGLPAQSVMVLISVGLLQGSMILSAQAYGAGNKKACGQTWKAAIVIALGLGVVFSFLCFLIAPALRFVGLDEQLVQGAGSVSLQFAWGMPAMLVYIASSYFLESTRRPWVGMLIMLGANLLNIIADGFVVLGWQGLVEPMGAAGAVMTTSAIRWMCAAAAILYIVGNPNAKEFGVFDFDPDLKSRIRKILILGAPISAALGLETAAMAMLAIMAGHIGIASAAAHQLTFNFNSVMVMVAVGISAASSVRVGHAIGARNWVSVRRAGFSGMALAVIVMTMFGVTVTLFSHSISAFYVQDPAVWKISDATLKAIGLLILIDGTMTVTMGVLRGMGDVLWPAFMHGIAFWFIGIPAAYLFAFSAEFGVIGLILGISLAMAVSLVLLVWRFNRISANPSHTA